MKKVLLLSGLALLCWQCGNNKQADTTYKPYVMEATIQQAIDSLTGRFGDTQKSRISEGVQLTASFWKESDGTATDFIDFCKENYIADTAMLDKVYTRIETNFEVIFGYFNKIAVDLQRPLQLDMGEILAVDPLFGSFNPRTHLMDDFFKNKIAFIITLNFPYLSLEEKNKLSREWTRKEWAYARLGDVFQTRLPASVNQLVVNSQTMSEMYIADYNIYAGKLVNAEGRTLFPPEMKLLSHWNIRDEIKSNYGKEAGIEKQRLLYEVMKRIISQEIPVEVINKDTYTWNPFTNKVYDKNGDITANAETDRRYAVLLDFFHAQQQVDGYYPRLNTYIKRNFESDMEIPLEQVEALFTEYLSSAEVQQVAAIIRQRLGRNLEPFDIWYDGFKTRTSIPAEILDNATRSRYPNRQAVQDDLPRLLTDLGFEKNKALEITSHIQVDPARGSGHATGSETRDQKSLLRTRIFSNGMDYKGYNIAVHEFGHNVEQTISLHNVDYYMLRGVPNTGFTEALAFMFQKRDLQLLGIRGNDPLQQYLDDLDKFWSLYEIMGVSMVDIGTWKWLYENPAATAGDLRDAMNRIARETWNAFFAPVFGMKDEPILAIYSHMINAPLYLPNYAYGDIIDFQIEAFIKDKNFATEIERIYSLGKLTPQQWMYEAVGSELSVQPMLDAANEAIKHL